MHVPRLVALFQAPSLHYLMRQERRLRRREISALRAELAVRAPPAAELPGLPIARPRSRGFTAASRDPASASLQPWRDEPVPHASVEFVGALLAELEVGLSPPTWGGPGESPAPEAVAGQPPGSPRLASTECAAARIQAAWRRRGHRDEQAQASPDGSTAAGNAVDKVTRPRRRARGPRRGGAATRIQAVWRGYALRRRPPPRLVSLREAGCRGATWLYTRLQALWRGYAVRKARRLTSIAVLLQRHWRGYAVRHREELEAEAQLHAMAPLPPAKYRACILAHLKKHGQTVSETELNAAVRKAVTEDLQTRDRLRALAARLRSDGSFR